MDMLCNLEFHSVRKGRRPLTDELMSNVKSRENGRITKLIRVNIAFYCEVMSSENNKNTEEFDKFLKNNEELLQEKYKEYFKKDTLIITSNNPSAESVVKFISDVFSFDKQANESTQEEEKRQMLEKVEKSLKESYSQYLKDNKSIKQFNAKIATDLLRYCIQNNQLFAVQYEMSNQEKQADNSEANSPKKSDEKGNEGHQSSNNKEEGSDFQLNRSQMSNEFEDGGRDGRNSSNFDMENQFNFHQQIKSEFDPIVIKKNTRVIFDYYCKQQMQLAPNLSFDRIERESSHLTWNKFLMMARLMNMLNSVITKDLLIKKFRKISQGRKEIDFKKFDILLSQLQVQDPTLVARSELSSPSIQAHLKNCKKPFDTQDMMPRQLVKNRIFQKKLTMHSGKMEEDLKADLQEKKSFTILENPTLSKLKSLQDIVTETKARNSVIRRYQSKQLYESGIKTEEHNYGPSRSPDIITTKKLNKNHEHLRNLSHDMNLVSKIIPASSDDDKWLGEYKIKLPMRQQSQIRKQQISSSNRRSFEDKHQKNAELIRELKNRIKQIERTEHDSSMEETRPNVRSGLGSPRRY